MQYFDYQILTYNEARGLITRNPLVSIYKQIKIAFVLAIKIDRCGLSLAFNIDLTDDESDRM